MFISEIIIDWRTSVFVIIDRVILIQQVPSDQSERIAVIRRIGKSHGQIKGALQLMFPRGGQSVFFIIGFLSSYIGKKIHIGRKFIFAIIGTDCPDVFRCILCPSFFSGFYDRILKCQPRIYINIIIYYLPVIGFQPCIMIFIGVLQNGYIL